MQPTGGCAAEGVCNLLDTLDAGREWASLLPISCMYRQLFPVTQARLPRFVVGLEHLGSFVRDGWVRIGVFIRADERMRLRGCDSKNSGAGCRPTLVFLARIADEIGGGG